MLGSIDLFDSVAGNNAQSRPAANCFTPFTSWFSAIGTLDNLAPKLLYRGVKLLPNGPSTAGRGVNTVMASIVTLAGSPSSQL